MFLADVVEQGIYPASPAPEYAGDVLFVVYQDWLGMPEDTFSRTCETIALAVRGSFDPKLWGCLCSEGAVIGRECAASKRAGHAAPDSD